MTAIFETMIAERRAEQLAAERAEDREEKLYEFLSVAAKFTDVCRLLTAGEPVLVAGHSLSISEDASTVELGAIFVDVEGVQHVAHGLFEGDVPPFDAVLLAASATVRDVAERLGLVELEERLTL
ncbi:hypothetical protein FDH48_gp51 [Arthrobacter phage Jawnski]|uniref:Uncharacterized protein n=1 Tax=Arthrobacter phage Jawnski TaxID=1772327 RepID=A0A0U4JHI9_9CAUD|nr:hypothetical protein FDH48_gp51 [Arthrobacter phage Jawnski]ALY09380.1 hypothetical protein JAWNSKI_51 [Arthrobacter phage Jawnski]